MNTNKRYWLRGGLIGLFFPLFLIVIVQAVHYSGLGNFPGFANLVNQIVIFFMIIGNPIGLLIEKIFHCGSEGLACAIGSFILSGLITYMLIGIILGWLYGKFKNK